MNRDASGRGIDILLVEDSPTDRLIAIEALQQGRVENTLNVVDNGVEAMAYLRREGKFKDARRPDLILLDLNLPKKDGREVLLEIKHDPRLKFIPVIVLTTSSADEDVARAYGDHANSYITKPVDFPRFARALETIGKYWFEVVTLPPELSPERLAKLERPRPSGPFGAQPSELSLVLLSADPVRSRDLTQLLAESESLRARVTHVDSLANLRDRIQGVRADVLLVDLAIGQSEGLRAYRQAHAAAPVAAIIVLTDDESLGELALREGAEDFIGREALTARGLLRSLRYATSRKQLLGELRGLQRLEGIGELASGIAQDFNNLLTLLHGHSELLADLDPSAPIAESVRGIQDASERAAQLTRRLLAFSQRQPAQLEPVDLNRAVNDFSKNLRRVLGSQVRLELRLAPRAPIALADIGRLEHLLLNLALRARAAMPGGGELVLETGRAVLDRAALPSPDAYAGAFATLTVRDTGSVGSVGSVGFGENGGTPGAEPPRRPGSLEPSRLSVVQGIVQQQGGWAEDESSLAAGSSLRIFLPETQPSHAPSPPARAVSWPRGTETILLVDDESPVRQMAKAILGRHGYQVLDARSGADAITAFEQSLRRIDVLLTDLVMPGGMTGRELADELLRREPSLKVIFTSGYGRDGAVQDQILNTGADFLPKPYRVSRLLGAVRRALDGGSAAEAPGSE